MIIRYLLKTAITVIIGVKKNGKRSKDQARFKKKKSEYIWFVSQVVMSIYNRYFVNKHIYWFTRKKRLQSHLECCKTALRGGSDDPKYETDAKISLMKQQMKLALVMLL